MTEPQSPTRPWRWLSGWVREESFWREVATRTFAILISGFVIWGVGVAIGAFQNPAIVNGFANTFQALALIGIIFAGVTEVRWIAVPGRLRHVFGQAAPPRWLAIIGAIGTFLAALVVGLDLFGRLFLGIQILF